MNAKEWGRRYGGGRWIKISKKRGLALIELLWRRAVCLSENRTESGGYYRDLWVKIDGEYHTLLIGYDDDFFLRVP